MRRLAQSTAYTVMLKAFLSSDHITVATGKTVAITISKAGGAFGNPAAGASNATEVSGGWYKFALGTGDTDTLGDLVIVGTATGCDPAEQIDMVVSATTGGATNLDAAVSAVKTKTDSLTFTGANKVDASVRDWIGGTIPAVNVAGVPLVDLKYTLGTISPATAGSVRADSVTGAVGSVTGSVGSVAGSVGGSVVGSVGSVTGSVGSVTGAVGSVTGNVGGNVVGSVGSVTGLTASNLDTTISSRLAAASYTAPDDTSIAAIKAKTDNLPSSPAAVGSAMALTSSERTSVADVLLDRDMSVGADSGSTTVRTVRQALRFLRNRWTILAGTLTVYKENDSSASWTSAVTTDAAAAPVISNDPAGP